MSATSKPAGEGDPKPQGGTPTVVIPTVGRRLAGATVIVGGAFVISRVLGLVREQVIAASYGTSSLYDTYIAAFKVPDLLFLLIISGVVGSAFIPVFTDLMTRGREQAAWRLTSTLINGSVMVLIMAGGVLALLAPLLVATVIAPGYPPDKQARVVDLMRILMLQPLFLGLGGWAQGVLNARQQFTLPALAPLAYNGCIILGALVFTPIWSIEGLAYGAVLGAIMHFLVQVPGLIRVGMRYSPARINIRDEGAQEVARLIGPRMLGQGAYQINIIVVTALATYLGAGRLAAFNYAYQLFLLPYGVFALSLATVIFPTLSDQFNRGALDELRGTVASALRVLTFLTVPAALGLGLLRYDIVALLFQLRQFDSNSTMLVAEALGWFAWGLLAYALLEILTRAFYAMHNTLTPVILAVGSMLLNIALSLIALAGFHMDHTGLALSLSASTTVEMILLYILLRRQLGGIQDRRVWRSVLISGVAAAEMGLVLWGLLPLLHAVAPDGGTGKLGELIVVSGAVLVGGGVYLGTARLLQAEELGMAWGLVRRRLGR